MPMTTTRRDRMTNTVYCPAGVLVHFSSGRPRQTATCRAFQAGPKTTAIPAIQHLKTAARRPPSESLGKNHSLVQNPFRSSNSSNYLGCHLLGKSRTPKEALINDLLAIPAHAGQKRLRVERPQGRPEGRAERVIQRVFNTLE